MITGIGVDIVAIKRMEKWILNPSLIERYFHPEELAYVKINGNLSAPSLAARFAAKEAFGKALGTGLKGLVLKDIMVKNRQNGQPEIVVFSSALKALGESSANRVHLSLSHENDNAIAMVVLEYVKT